jgi:hypothetical protein
MIRSILSVVHVIMQRWHVRMVPLVAAAAAETLWLLLVLWLWVSSHSSAPSCTRFLALVERMVLVLARLCLCPSVGLCLARVELSLGGLHARTGVGLHVQETNGRFSQLRLLLATLTAPMHRRRTARASAAAARLTWRRRAAILTMPRLFMHTS